METTSKAVEPTIEEDSNPFAKIPKRLIVIEGLENGDKQIGRLQSNHVLMIRKCRNTKFTVQQNQRLSMLILADCKKCTLSVLDSAVIASRTLRVINCDDCEIVLEDVDVRKVECWNTKNTRVIFINEQPLVENHRVIWRDGCTDGNEVRLSAMEHNDQSYTLKFFTVRSSNVPEQERGQIITKFDELGRLHHVPLLTEAGKLNEEGVALIAEMTAAIPLTFPAEKKWNQPDALPTAEQVLKELKVLEETLFAMSTAQLDDAYDSEREEFEEPEESLRKKVKAVAQAMVAAKHVVVYTGAGVSTSANIPDFRGPQGVWTLRAKGRDAPSKHKRLDQARPTYTHYAITHLVRKHLAHFVISTNMDGLHLRSGLPRHLIIEQHGNCYKEICENCQTEYFRQYNTLKTVTHSRKHFTGRNCTFCGGRLQDTIVHFSENFRGEHVEPLSLFHARKCDFALVMGTSMNVQPAAAYPDKALKNPNGQLAIVNLQKTPYDQLASIRIFAKTDKFMEMLMEELKLAEFDRETDAIDDWDAEDTLETESEADSGISLVYGFIALPLLLGGAALVGIVGFLRWKRS